MIPTPLILWCAIVCLGNALASPIGPTSSELFRIQRAMRSLGDESIVADATSVQLSPACGNGAGVFAKRALRPGEILATVPISKCLSSADACADPTIGPACRAFLTDARGDSTAEGVAVAALLVHIRSQSTTGECSNADDLQQWGPYVDSLPWGRATSVDDGSNGEEEALIEEDPLQEHTLVAAIANKCPDVVGQDRLDKAQKSAYAVAKLLQGTAAAADPLACEALCFRALVLVASRAFDFSHSWKEHSKICSVGDLFEGNSEEDFSACTMSFVMVPFLDLFNHPSASALAQAGPSGAAFQQLSPKAACIDVQVNFDLQSPGSGASSPSPGGCVSVSAPQVLPVNTGDELWNWYSNAGFGSKTREEMANAVLEFKCSYGFNPWL